MGGLEHLRRHRAATLRLALGFVLLLANVTRAEEPAAPPALAQAEAPEAPLEGDLKRQYEEQLAAYGKELRAAREPGAVEAVMKRLALLPGRPARDAVIRFVRAAKDPQLLNLAVNLLAKRTDGVSLRFVCGPDGLGSYHAHAMDSWASEAIRTARNPALVPYLLEVAADRKAKALVVGLATRLVAELAPKDPRVIEAAFRAARDKRPEARYPGLEALGHVATPEAIGLLLDGAEKDPDAYVRGSAYTGVANAKRFDLLPRLRELLAKEGSSAVRSEGADAIAKLEALEREARARQGR